jgi:TonB family protein
VSTAVSGLNTRALRELGMALRNAPFRAALALSLLMHLTLLLVMFHGRAGEKRDQVVKLMQVRLLQPAPDPVPSTIAPLVPPAVKPPARERAEPPAAVISNALVDLAPAAPMPPATAPADAPPPSAVEPSEQPGKEAGAQAKANDASIIVATARGGEDQHVSPETTASSQASAVTASATEPLLDAEAGSSTAAAISGVAESTMLPAGPASGTGSASQPSAGGAAQGDGAAPAGTGAQAGGQELALNAGQGGTAARMGAPGGYPGQKGPDPRGFADVKRRIEARKIYPTIAIRNGWQGDVLVEMHLEVDGRLADVRLLKGSGYAVLDEATITAVRRASPFPPIARRLEVPVEYHLVP